jgi:hypothetical protein
MEDYTQRGHKLHLLRRGKAQCVNRGYYIKPLLSYGTVDMSRVNIVESGSMFP